MRICLLFVLLLNAFIFAQSCDIKPLPAFLDGPEKRELAKVRDSLLTSLQAQDSSEVFRYVAVLKNSGYGERALDNYELLQIYFLMNQYDSLLVTLVREHYRFINKSYVGVWDCSNEAPFSAFDDELLDSLQIRADLQRHLKLISEGSAKQEYRDFANLMIVMLKDLNYHHISKQYYGLDNDIKRNAIQKRRFHRYGSRNGSSDDENDTLLIEKLIAFQNKYPESEFNPWITKQVELKQASLETDFDVKHYYIKRYYTGGIGGEYFHAIGSGYQINAVLQIQRLILGFGYWKHDELCNGFDVYIGFDVYESKYIKTFPFVMGVINKSEHNPLGGGLQFEFRPWISELGREAPIGGYLTINARYELLYGSEYDNRENDESKKKLRNLFHLGVGLHLW
jgi:hypothetical protein